MLRPSSPVHTPSPGGPAGSLGASLLRDACGAPDGLRCCGPLPAEFWGFTWPQLRFKAGSRVGSRGKSLILRQKDRLGQRSVVTAEKPPRLINCEFFCKTGTSPIPLCHLKELSQRLMSGLLSEDRLSFKYTLRCIHAFFSK